MGLCGIQINALTRKDSPANRPLQEGTWDTQGVVLYPIYEARMAAATRFPAGTLLSSCGTQKFLRIIREGMSFEHPSPCLLLTTPPSYSVNSAKNMALHALLILCQFFLHVYTAYSQRPHRQTAQYANTTTVPDHSSTITASASPSITGPPPCCWLAGGTWAVGLLRWHDTTYTVTTATVVTTFLRYGNNSAAIANSTTLTRPRNETFTNYGIYDNGGNVGYRVTITYPVSIPTDIIADGLLETEGDYAATSFVSEAIQSYDFTDMTVYASFGAL
jgi:hypothetical protein